mgnify:CR=1 FL=1
MEIKNTINLDTNSLVKESLSKAFSYQDYREQVATHVEYGTSSGPDKSEALSNYTLLNNSRMKRLDKTMKIEEDVLEKFKQYHKNVTWLVLTESWCGDAAHAMPVMNKLVEQAKNLDFKILYRDENKELMNRFLTNGSKSIPKLIMIDAESFEVLDVYGSRPSIVTTMVENYKKEHGQLTSEFKEDLQRWYNKDKGQSTIKDLAALIS